MDGQNVNVSYAEKVWQGFLCKPFMNLSINKTLKY